MARRTNVNEEPYAGFIPPSQIDQCKPTNMFYTADSKCKRYFCAVCGDCHPVNSSRCQRITEWLTGTTMPDALYRSREANIIDEFTQLRFKEVRRVDDNPCVIADARIEQMKKKANALHTC
ncbi:unnamed protein product [Calicophoron daubneyi]|uniref:Uncharacterized protein n=1 Tax=Calicophoron daubneyi TaxID=300641 RepID=A0AAV2TIE3_CALDB